VVKDEEGEERKTKVGGNERIIRMRRKVKAEPGGRKRRKGREKKYISASFDKFPKHGGSTTGLAISCNPL